MKVKDRELRYKATITKVEDFDEKGQVKFYASIFGNKDKAGDIVNKGAYNKTISENFKEIQHYKNHDNRLMPGVVIEAREDDKGLFVVSKLILGTQLGKETYEEYKAMAEAGKSMFHSIGYIPVIEEQKDEANYLKEIYLKEVSTLTAHPANSEALMVDIKSEVDYLNALLKADLSNASLEKIEEVKNKLQALIESKAAMKALENRIEPPTISKQELLNIFKF